jgi:hypothetical protein
LKEVIRSPIPHERGGGSDVAGALATCCATFPHLSYLFHSLFTLPFSGAALSSSLFLSFSLALSLARALLPLSLARVHFLSCIAGVVLLKTGIQATQSLVLLIRITLETEGLGGILKRGRGGGREGQSEAATPWAHRQRVNQLQAHELHEGPPCYVCWTFAGGGGFIQIKVRERGVRPRDVGVGDEIRRGEGQGDLREDEQALFSVQPTVKGVQPCTPHAGMRGCV